MTISRSAAMTDAGRRRRRNEDSYIREPPLFAIADGMGGAQAGELASQLAATAFREAAGTEASPEQQVTDLILEANRRVFARSSEDQAVSGMGTTATVALVHDGGVTIGHVGDSRAYLIRDGRLEQVTEDHSLVSELVRSGKLSPEEADSHPQRSVITRVLGTEPDVDVDTFSVRTQPGDLFLLCSDGLTSMVDDQTILEIVDRNRTNLDGAVRELVRTANRKGGEDNITVICFEIDGAVAEDTAPTLHDEATLTEVDGVPAIATDGRHGWDGDEWAPPDAEPAPPRRRRRRRTFAIAAIILIVLALAVAGGLLALSRAHFVGVEKDGHVAVYQGVPWNLVGGVRLYRTVYVSRLRAAQLSQAERRRLFDHELTSEGTAVAKLRPYERQIPGTP